MEHRQVGDRDGQPAHELRRPVTGRLRQRRARRTPGGLHARRAADRDHPVVGLRDRDLRDVLLDAGQRPQPADPVAGAVHRADGGRPPVVRDPPVGQPRRRPDAADDLGLARRASRCTSTRPVRPRPCVRSRTRCATASSRASSSATGPGRRPPSRRSASARTGRPRSWWTASRTGRSRSPRRSPRTGWRSPTTLNAGDTRLRDVAQASVRLLIGQKTGAKATTMELNTDVALRNAIRL